MSILKNIQGVTQWRSPSNIALVKYWGKYGQQLPRNPSISFTLSEAYTETKVAYASKLSPSNEIEVSFLFDGQPKPAFEAKIRQFLSSIVLHFPYLLHLRLNIESTNSFPHSTGIASSASSMSALALCLVDIEAREMGGMKPHDFYEKASFIARLGSGSACRSVYPFAAMWGKYTSFPFSSNEYAVPFDELHPIFKDFRDTILIISKTEKAVSSRAGHALMEGHPYAEVRYTQACRHVGMLATALQQGDLDLFGKIVELEALTLHALMMASETPFILLQPNTLLVIEKVKQWRTAHQVPVYFTLDAGPNIHLLYPSSCAEKVDAFIKEELSLHCEQEQILWDKLGNGPSNLSSINNIWIFRLF